MRENSKPIPSLPIDEPGVFVKAWRVAETLGGTLAVLKWRSLLLFVGMI